MSLSNGDSKLFELVEPYIKYIIALVFAWIIWILGVATYERNSCSNSCEAKGFYDFRYKPQNKFGGYRFLGTGERASCHCYTEEEANMKGTVPKGTEINL